MKRFRKALLALAALLGVVIVGSLWLINSALNVASDVVDSTLGGAQKVQAAAQREIVGAAKSAQNSADTALAGADNPAPASTETAPTASLTSKASEPTVGKTANSASKPSEQKETSAPKNQKDEEMSLADLGGLVNLFLNDGEDAPDLTGLLNSGDKNAKDDKPNAKNADDTLTDMIPGANSPTVKKWMSGKYKGKEAQALDDALEDPKILRVIFLLGGM